MFARNMSTLDRNLRVAAGLVLDMWFFTGWIDGPLRWSVGLACLVLLGTASARYCPVYALTAMRGKALPPEVHHVG